MKKLLSTLVALTVITVSVSAQNFKKSDKILEGSISLTKEKGSDAEYTIAPSFGYFVTDKIALGVSAEIGTSADGDVTNFGAFARKYFHSIGKNFMAYTQLNVGSNTTKADGTKVSEFATGLGLGANYFVSQKVAITAHMADLVSYKSGDGTSSFSMGFTGFNNPLSMSRFGILIKL